MRRRGWIAVGIVLAVGAGVLWRAPHRSDQEPPAGPDDGCLYCHASPDHDPGGLHAFERVACQLCHLGDPTGRTVETGHVGLEREPGALDTVEKTCGACHAREAETVRRSLMATGAGIIAVDRWAFGELDVPVDHRSMVDVLGATDPSPAEDHLRRLCAGCHLNTRTANRDDAVRDIGSGCSACHSARRADGVHPPVDGVVPDTRCLGCHSRSSRIALSYAGLAEIDPDGPCDATVELFDGRSGCRLEADVHAAAGMGCTDCHVHTELMGDGVAHARQREATHVTCETCHGTPAGADARPRTVRAWGDIDDPISETLLRLRGAPVEDHEPAVVATDGTPLWHVRRSERGWMLQPKQGGEALVIPLTSASVEHTIVGHERLACTSCHATWIPTCPTCHTDYDPTRRQWDFGRGGLSDGAWVETHESLSFGPPTLAVTPEDRIVPAAPGMIATLAASSAGGTDREVRLFSAFDPHTTTATARGCTDCHASAVAVGYGRGELTLGDRVAEFVAEATDGADGWVSPSASEPGQGTYPGVRSLDAAERDRVLEVGRCLQCHAPDEDTVWTDFRRASDRGASGACSWMTRR